MAQIVMESKHIGRGRPKGAVSTETSDLVARIQEAATAQGILKQDLADEAGTAISTWRRYATESILPVDGDVRKRINRMAKKYGVAQ